MQLGGGDQVGFAASAPGPTRARGRCWSSARPGANRPGQSCSSCGPWAWPARRSRRSSRPLGGSRTMAARYRPGPGLEPAPGRTVETPVLGQRPAPVLVVAEQQHAVGVQLLQHPVRGQGCRCPPASAISPAATTTGLVAERTFAMVHGSTSPGPQPPAITRRATATHPHIPAVDCCAHPAGSPAPARGGSGAVGEGARTRTRVRRNW